MADKQERAAHLLSDQDGMSTPDQDSHHGEQPRKNKKRVKKHRKRNTILPSGSSQTTEEKKKENIDSEIDQMILSRTSQRSRVFGTEEGKLGSVNIETNTWVPDPEHSEQIDGNITITASYPSLADLYSSGPCSYPKTNSTSLTTSLNSSMLHNKKKWYKSHLRSKSEGAKSRWKMKNADGKGARDVNWWKVYNTQMVKSYEHCLLNSSFPTKQTVLIDYFISMYKSEEGSPKSMQPTNIKLKLEILAENLDRGTDIDFMDSYGQTILMEAVRSWHIDIVNYLLENDADINHYDYSGRAPMHIAAATDRPEIIELLYNKGASVNIKSKVSCETPLHLAARRGSSHAVDMLLRIGANKEVQDYCGRTPLYLAVEYNRETAVGLLLDAGARVDIIDREKVSLLVQMALTSSVFMEKALNSLMQTDTITGRCLMSMNILEVCPNEWYEEIKTNCFLDIIESEENGSAVKHIAVKKLIKKRWDMFGRRYAIVNFFFRFLFFLVWTLWILIIRWEEKAEYSWPDDSWRIVLPVIGLVALVWELYIETSEIMYSIRRGVRMARISLARLTKDKQHLVHPCWPDEYDQMQELSKETERKTYWWQQTYQYHKDLWNLYDLAVFALLIACMVTHVVDVLDHTIHRSRIHGQLGSVVILLLGIRLMKETRGFVWTGELVIMLGLMAVDFWRFIFLYLQLYIPFTIAFWIIFGGKRYPHDSRICMFNCTTGSNNVSMYVKTIQGWTPDFDICSTNCSTITVAGMETYAHLCFSLFRLTLVDEYDLETMRTIDPILSYLLVCTFLVTSAIVGINFLIGLISNALGDGARQYVERHTALQKVRVINLIEQTYYLCPPHPDDCREQILHETEKGMWDLGKRGLSVQTVKATLSDMQKDISHIPRLLERVDHIQQEQARHCSLFEECLKEKKDEKVPGDIETRNSHTQTGRVDRKWLASPSGVGKLGSFVSDGQDFDMSGNTGKNCDDVEEKQSEA